MDERQRLKKAIKAQENLRGTMDDDIIDAAIAAINKQIVDLEKPNDSLAQHRRLVTVLYADIVGSTDIVKDLDPEDALQIMDGALKHLAVPVEEHGGHLARFMGDGFKAVFGSPVAHENDPEMAIRAGLGILEASLEHAEVLVERWGIHDFKVRVGINTGLVAIGGLTEADDTVMGSTVNLGARMESAAPPGGLLISHNTYRHVRGVFDVESLAPIELKGFDEPMPVYLVLRSKPRAFKLRTLGVEGVETRMVGRELELKRLQDALLAAVEDGEGQVVTLTGEAGVGKSRLLYEFQNWIELMPDVVRLYQGRSRQETQHQPYALMRDVFAFRFQIQDSDTASVVRQKIESGFGEVWGTDKSGEARAHAIGHLLGFDFSTSRHLQGLLDDPQQLRDQALNYLIEYYQSITAQVPTVIFLEDIHWADDSSLDVVNHLGCESPEQRLLIICLARPTLFERRPYWGEGLAFHHHLELDPLSKRESRQLVAEILQSVEQVPAALRELVVSGAEGNPFYIEELIKMLIEDGVILTGAELWRIDPHRLAEIDVPSTLAGVLQARLDSLPPAERNTLQQASVVGRTFWDDTVGYISTESGQDDTQHALSNTDEHLSSLRSRELIYHREESTFADTGEFIFKHAVLRDVTYESVLKRLRCLFHGLAADWLIAHSGERISEYTGIIADHLELAGKAEAAITYLIKAGDQARGLYAHQEAINHYQRALALLKGTEDHERTARTLMSLGLTYHNAFEYGKSRQAYEEGFSAWQQADKAKPQIMLPPAPQALRITMLEPPTLDPSRSTDVESKDIIDQLFSGLVEMRPDMSVVPDVAHRWEVLADGRKYRFHLREDVCWSDGVPVTAGDFVYAWRRVLEPSEGSRSFNVLHDIQGARDYHRGELTDPKQLGIRAIDETTLEVRLTEPTSYFLQLLTYTITFPVPKHVVEVHGTSWTQFENIVTNGPFRLADLKPGETIVLERSPSFHGRFSGNLQRVDLLTHASPLAEALEMYNDHQIDVLWFSEINTEARDHARQRHTGELRSGPGLSVEYIGFDVHRPPLDDSRVRRALTLAANREKIADITLGGYYSPATGGFVPPGIPGHSPKIGFPFDPEQALILLAEAGYPGGRGFPPLEAWVPRRPQHISVADELQSQWREHLGVEIVWEVMDWGDYLEMLRAERPHMWTLGWSADYPDPDNFLRTSELTSLGWQNETFNKLVESARRVADQAERMSMYQQADMILIEEAAVLPLIYGHYLVLVKPWVRKFPISPIRGTFWKDVIIEPH